MSMIIKLALLLLGATLIALIVRVVIANANHSAAPVVVTAKVRVSTANLPVGLLLRDEDLGWKTIPANEVPPNAVVEGMHGGPEFKGALLRHPVSAGTVLVTTDVILPSAPGFLAATLKPGMRAVSVAVDDVSGNAGLIQPGDYVDLLLTQQMAGRTESPELAVSSETVVEYVRVLASGSEIQRPKDGDQPDANNRVRTVTLEVTPRMAEVVSVAARLGSLSLALRSFATDTRDPGAYAHPASQPAPVWAGDISRAVRELPRTRAPRAGAERYAAAQPVVVYRGSERADSATGIAAPGGGAGNGVAPPPLPTLPATH
jgi:pilus assembly protein CpaB